MVAPFPYEAVAGAVRDVIEAEALNLFANYAWVVRLADEMNAEKEIDLKRAKNLVFHARQFRFWYDALQARVSAGSHTQAQIADVIEGVFGAKKCRWPTRLVMNADLSALHAAFGALADWIETNAGQYKQGYSVLKEISPGVDTDESIKIAKPAAAASRLSEFRALFAANTAALAKKG